MLLVDERDNSIRYANPASADFFSIPKDRLIGRNFLALIGSQFLPSLSYMNRYFLSKPVMMNLSIFR